MGAWRASGGSGLTYRPNPPLARRRSPRSLTASSAWCPGRSSSHSGSEPARIKHRLAIGRLRPLRRGVYAVGHRALRSEACWLAAVLAAGPDAVLAGRSAAALWRVRKRRSAGHRGDLAAAARPAGHRRASHPAGRRRGDRGAGHPGHDAGPHAARPRDRRRTTPPRACVPGGGGPPPHEPDLARCPRRALPRTQGNAGDQGAADEASGDRPNRPNEHPRAPPSCAPRCPWSAPAADQPAESGRRARRHVAQAPPDRRVRRLRDARHAQGVRGGSRQGPRAHSRRLARRPHHLAPADRRPGDDRAAPRRALRAG